MQCLSLVVAWMLAVWPALATAHELEAHPPFDALANMIVELDDAALELNLAPVTGSALVETLAIERERHPWRRLHMADAGAARFAEVLKREPDLHPPVLVSPAARALVPDAFRLIEAPAEVDGQSDSAALVFSGAWDEVLLDYAAARGLAVEALVTLGPAFDADQVTLEGNAPWTILWIALVLPDEAGQASARVQLERAHEAIVAAVKRERQANVDASIDAAAESRALQAAAAKCAAVPETSLLDWLGVEWLAKDNRVALKCALDIAGSGVAAEWMATLPGLQALLDEGTRALDDAAQLERLASALRHLNVSDETKPDLLALLLDPEQASWVAERKAAPEAFLAMARLRFAALEGLHAFPSAAQLLAYNVFKPELGRQEFVDAAQLDAAQ